MGLLSSSLSSQLSTCRQWFQCNNFSLGDFPSDTLTQLQMYHWHRMHARIDFGNSSLDPFLIKRPKEAAKGVFCFLYVGRLFFNQFKLPLKALVFPFINLILHRILVFRGRELSSQKCSQELIICIQVDVNHTSPTSMVGLGPKLVFVL